MEQSRAKYEAAAIVNNDTRLNGSGRDTSSVFPVGDRSWKILCTVRCFGILQDSIIEKKV